MSISNARMISSLPTPTETTNVDIAQTKLALDILKKMSVTGISVLNSKINHHHGHNTLIVDENNYIKNQTNYYHHILHNDGEINQQKFKNHQNQHHNDNKSDNNIIVDQFNPTPSSVSNIPSSIELRNNDECDCIQSHEMLATSEDETYCSQYYQNHHHHHPGGRTHTHHRHQHHYHIRNICSPMSSSNDKNSISLMNARTSSPHLLFRSFSSPISSISTPDSIRTFLTAKENNSISSSSTSSSSSSSLETDDENYKKSKSNKSKIHHFYDSTSSSSSTSASFDSIHSTRDRRRRQKRCSKHFTNDKDDLKRLSSKDHCEDSNIDEPELVGLKRDHESDDDDDSTNMDENKLKLEMMTDDNNSLAKDHKENDVIKKTDYFDSKADFSPSSDSIYSTPCGCNNHHQHHDHHEADNAKIQSNYNVNQSSQKRSGFYNDDSEIKHLRDQLLNEKLLQSFPDESSSSFQNNSGIPTARKTGVDMSDDDGLVIIPSKLINNLDEYRAMFIQSNCDSSKSCISSSGNNNNHPRNNNRISVEHLQNLLDCFKINQIPTAFGEKLLSTLKVTQVRDDFQWALHQMGGFHVLLILYGRVVEISQSDHLQSQGLNLVLSQLKNHGKLTDPPLANQYHLLRYLLNSENSTFGFETYKVLLSHCLNPCSQRIQDYSLLLICIMESWKILIRTKCSLNDLVKEHESGIEQNVYTKFDSHPSTSTSSSSKNTATTKVTLLQHFLTTINLLCSESNSQRDINVGILKENGFAESLLTLCKGVIYCVTEENECKSTISASSATTIINANNNNNSQNTFSTPTSCNLTIDDGLVIASLVKSILTELNAPPDANIAKTLVQFGLLPFLPNELPPLPIKENSFFVYPEESDYDDDYSCDLSTTPLQTSAHESLNLDLSFADEAKEYFKHEGHSDDSDVSSDEDNVDKFSPELQGKFQLSIPKKLQALITNSNDPTRRGSLNLVINSEAVEFLTIFQETLIEGLMTILLNSLAILPDASFNNVLNPHLSYHVLVAYCSHSNTHIKSLALKLISTFLSRVNDSVIHEFLRNRGFFLTSLYLSSTSPSKLSNLIVNVANGFGPVAYSMMMAFIYSPIVVSTLIQWMKADATSIAPALLSVGLLPSIIYYYKTSPINSSSTTPNKFPTQLSHLLTLVTKYIVLNPKNEPWSILFCPGIESSTKSSLLCSKLVRDAIEILRSPLATNSSQLKRNEIFSRLLWLFENSVSGRYGPSFEKWLFKTFLIHVFDFSPINLNESHRQQRQHALEPTEAWKFFVKKNIKRLHYLMGVFLCNIFAPSRCDNSNIYYNFQQYVLRELLSCISTPNTNNANKNNYNNNVNNNNWLAKSLKADEQIQHCFKTFMTIYFNENEHHPKIGLRQTSFQKLPLSPSPNNLINEEEQNIKSTDTTNSPRNSQQQIQLIDSELEAQTSIFHLSDRSINLKFQNLLISMGIISPAGKNNLSKKTPITQFKALNILLEPKSSVGQEIVVAAQNQNYDPQHSYYGTVPYHELRQSLVLIEKLRVQQQSKYIKPSVIKSTFKRNHQNVHKSFNQSSTRGNTYRRGSSSSNESSSSTSSGSASSVPFHISNSKPYFDSVFEIVNKLALDVVDVCTKLRSRQEIEIARRLSIREVDIIARQKWWDIRERMTHPKAPWYFPDVYPSFWALDQSEGPGRIRIRLRKEPLKVGSQFVKPEFRKEETITHPLQYLFYSSSEQYMGYAGVQSDIKFIRSCLRIVPGEELFGEIILTDNSLHFIPEVCNRKCWDRIDIMKSSIFQILRRRYTLEDRALELFVASRCFLFVFKSQNDRESFIQILSPHKNSLGTSSSSSNASSSSNGSQNNNTSSNSDLLNATLTTMTTQWIKGNLSNFDYLMHLNTAAGRTNCDLMQYPVFPFVLSKYNTSSLDLLSQSSYRDLRKPMAIQDPAKEDHFMSTYNYLKREGDSAPFHYGSHYSNSGIVLHFLVRLPPYTQHFLKYQDGNFDIPDRSFHSIETAWRLASRDSNTDFKEMIPEFFYLPEFLLNLQNFDLGVRQNGSRVDDVILPEWCNNDARLFTLINRQALESNQVRKYLSDWVDLIFGYKQTGTYAIQALNVFHPSTYEGFEVDADGTDDLVRRARKAMVSTYGQTPKRLFGFPHPRAQIQQGSQEEMSNNDKPSTSSTKIPLVLPNITGLRWGSLIGSPVNGDYEVLSSREFHEEISLFETISRVVFWPVKTLILGDAVVGSWDASGIRIKSNILYLCIGDEITTCCGIDTNIWIGHESGKITVLKLSSNLTKVLESIDLIGHYKAIKCIDLNNEFSTAFSCSGENYTMAWDMNTVGFCNVIECSEQIDFVYSSRSTGDLLLLNHKANTVTYTTINGFKIGTIEHDEKIESVCISNLDPGRNVNLIAIGCDYGIIRFYSSWDLKFLSQTKVSILSTLPIKSIRYSKDGRRLYCLSQTDKTCLTVALQLAPPRKNSSRHVN